MAQRTDILVNSVDQKWFYRAIYIKIKLKLCVTKYLIYHYNLYFVDDLLKKFSETACSDTLHERQLP